MKRYEMESLVGIFVVIGIICVGYMTIKLGKVQLFGDDELRISARFKSVSGLRVGSPVEMFGINVGTVERLSIDKERDMAVVKMKIREALKIYDDGSASIKTSGLIGDKFVKIDPGGGGDLIKSGGWITETNSPLDIEDIVGKFAFGNVGKNPSTTNEELK